jgi:hypothetical protein
MRRICLFLFLSLLVVPAAAVAADRAVGDGSLAVTGASGTIIVQGKGVIFGHFDRGTLMVVDYKPDDPNAVISVTGAKPVNNRGTIVYPGSDVRFLLPSGRYTIEVIATGIDVSAVGSRGIVGATGFGTLDDGTYAVNGGKPVPLTTASASQAFGSKS